MTDSEKFMMVEKIKKDIQKMGFSIEIFHNRQIQIGSVSYTVFWESNGLFEVIAHEINHGMNKAEWEEFVAEVDNLNRAILWVNTQLKDIVFS